jgi:hypothetical protein
MPRKYKILLRQGSGVPTAANWDAAEPAFDPTAGRLYVKGTTEMVEFASANYQISRTISTTTITALALSDLGRLIVVSALTQIEVPTDTSVSFPVGAQVWIYSNYAENTYGTLSVIAADSNTTNVYGVGSSEIPGRTLILLTKVAANTWLRLTLLTNSLRLPNGTITALSTTTTTAGSYRLSAVTTSAATTLTLNSTHNGAILRFTASSAVTITIPTGLGAAFSCSVIQEGTGQITITPDAGVTRNAFGGATKTAGQYAVATLIATAANTFILGGQVVT